MCSSDLAEEHDDDGESVCAPGGEIGRGSAAPSSPYRSVSPGLRQRKQIPFEEVYDLFAIRIVFKPLPFPSEKTQCYQIYATITDIYTPKPDRLRDWINTPKANGYEALH